MSTRTKVSVVVPIYNAEKRLRKCLDSIISQTLKDIEIICINDGSTDCSLSILEEYKKKDHRIKIFSKQNAGLVAARKDGCRLAQGEYIGYVDSDDYIDSDMFENLYSKAQEYDADMVSSGIIIEGNYISKDYDAFEPGFYSQDKMISFRNNSIFDYTIQQPGIRSSLCTKIFKTSIMKKIQQQIPDTITYCEDKLCVFTYILNCNSVYIMHECFYHYVMNNTSMTHSCDENYLIRVNEVYRYFNKLKTHPNFTGTMCSQADLYVVQILIKGINSRMGLSFNNLLWIDPYWMKEIGDNIEKIVIYGGGELGATYYKQITTNDKFKFIACVDYNYKKMTGYPFDVQNPIEVKNMDYDAVVITIKDIVKAEEIKIKLIDDGILEEKIYIFDQREIFWKYAEALGILNTSIHKNNIDI